MRQVTTAPLPEHSGATRTGAVFNIQRFCTHDGPGIRTTVFLKGCPLHCPWCHNPEGLSQAGEIGYDPARCIGCRACETACVHQAHSFTPAGEHLFDAGRCTRCGACVETCYAGAMERIGQVRAVSEVMEVVVRDKPFYDNSEGGMTLSGGEPLAQPDFTTALLEACRLVDIGTALETSALAPWEYVESLVPLVDYWMCDVKHLDETRHRQLTGAGNARILGNVRQLAELGVRLLLRLPLVPGQNDDPAGMEALGQLVALARPSEGLEIMPYHRIGSGKYARLGRDYTLAEVPEATDAEIVLAATRLRQAGASHVFCQRLPEL
jgi:pyruvate formate lyase activating enzyme